MLLSSLTSKLSTVPSYLGSSLLSGVSDSLMLPVMMLLLWYWTSSSFCSIRSRFYCSESRWSTSFTLRCKFLVVFYLVFSCSTSFTFLVVANDKLYASIVAVLNHYSVYFINSLKIKWNAVDVLENAIWSLGNSSED